MSWRVVLTGPECTGKTTLSLVLADRLGAAWVPETARAYAEARGGVLSAIDVDPIGVATRDALEQAYATDARMVVADTDLLSTMVYARHYYGSCPAWIDEACRRLRADLYLLCAPDLPWEPDGVRDRPDPAERAAMHVTFEKAVQSVGAAFAHVRGTGTARVEAALEAVHQAAPEGVLP